MKITFNYQAKRKFNFAKLHKKCKNDKKNMPKGKIKIHGI